MNSEENMKLMKTLDDAWNSQDWDTFTKRHTDDSAPTHISQVKSLISFYSADFSSTPCGLRGRMNAS